MQIDNTAFGEITIDGKTYEHDVIIRLSGEVVKRKKRVLEEAVRYLARRVEGRSEIRVRKGVQAAYPWLGPRGQCAALPRG